MIFFISNLDVDLTEGLRSRSIAEDQLPLIREEIKANQEQKRKIFRIALIVCAVIYVLLAINMLSQLRLGLSVKTAILFLLGFAALLALVFAMAYYFLIGTLSVQFNLALKKGYPELADLYKL